MLSIKHTLLYVCTLSLPWYWLLFWIEDMKSCRCTLFTSPADSRRAFTLHFLLSLLSFLNIFYCQNVLKAISCEQFALKQQNEGRLIVNASTHGYGCKHRFRCKNTCELALLAERTFFDTLPLTPDWLPSHCCVSQKIWCYTLCYTSRHHWFFAFAYVCTDYESALRWLGLSSQNALSPV